MFKIWDNIFGSVWQGPCGCTECSRDAGKRSRKEWEKVVKYDYSVLLKPSFWLDGKDGAKKAA